MQVAYAFECRDNSEIRECLIRATEFLPLSFLSSSTFSEACEAGAGALIGKSSGGGDVADRIDLKS